ncbi:hypothetical protein BASA61_010212 [Batrachochytrium salamandrivorans]|nr:hypothetical protein BASA60_007268 [Batrachochytrium salamandrivorans]KAH6573937.1 hypothetical protein BASA62_002699 [Batrachochytrium salamandrivorans]KAH6579460.1 hypothetical protein BASA61_010212 [Batrachochytrium salamandrivorans]KAH9274436.1 hypothetical protein BASA83_003067 [Batrachochytrium salamandrivorans]
MSYRDIVAETSQLLVDLIDCDRRDYAQVNRILDRISELVPIHIKANAERYLYEDDFAGGKQMDPFNESATAHGLVQLQRCCTPWLVSLLNKPPQVPTVVVAEDMDRVHDYDTESSNAADAFLDRISSIMCLMCGRTVTGECSTTWHLQATGSYSVMETTYTEAEIGFQTWGGGIMLAKMIDQKVIDVAGHNVLELGCGTGLAGLVAARSGSNSVVLTDYHPVVISNAQRNIEANNVDAVAQVLKLDWLWSMSAEYRQKTLNLPTTHGGDVETSEQAAMYALELEQEDPILRETDFKLVIAADCVFDLMHSDMVPVVAKRYLSKHIDARFHVVLPHREKFRMELAAFEANMITTGWVLEFSEWIEKSTINFRYYIYKLSQ